MRSSFNQFFDRMTKTKIFLIAVLFIGIIVFASYRLFNINDDSRDQLLQNILIDGVKTQHYNPEAVNDDFSQKVFSLFLERMDNGKKFFTQEDISILNTYQKNIDDEINADKYEFFEKINSLYEIRLKQVKGFYTSLLDKPFDFTIDESIETDGKKQSYAKDTNELKNQWRLYFKYQTLIRYNGMIEDAEKAKAKKDTSYHEKSLVEMEKDARAKVKKSNDDLMKRLEELDKQDRYNLYLNTLVNVQDPHTEYFPPADKANFDIAMTGQLQGIGAQLQEKDGYIKVSAIIVGGPAYRDGKLKANDIILKVQQEGGEAVDIVDMRLDKAVQLIRGKKGTKVTLNVKKPDGGIEDITITRDIVIIEETYAQSAVINNSKEKIGYIRLPGFYSDFGKGGRDCATDINNELIKLKAENVDGIVLDLRDNGGGSLEAVVRMVGLFIKTGPVVQVKTRTGAAQVMSDNDASVTYDGPLVVMVNENSASASEILAAAIQDYKRGIIIGSPTTFGKGTVQRVYNLDDMLASSYDALKPLGSLKITMQKFYRINGASTQLKGVTPDVIIPDVYSMIKYGEKEEDYPMPWDEISAAKYDEYKANESEFNKVISSSSSRVKADKTFTIINEQAKEFKNQGDNTLVPLNLEKYKQRLAKAKEDDDIIDEIRKTVNPLTVINIQKDADALSGADSTKVNRNKTWLKDVAKDIYIQEANNICQEIK